MISSAAATRWAAAAALGILVTACGNSTGSNGSNALPELRVTHFADASPILIDIIQTQPQLAKVIPARVTVYAITGGPGAMAMMKGGLLDIAGAIGNPPVTAAIANGTDIKVIWPELYDSGWVVVKSNLSTPDQMVGKTFGTLAGSSEDYSFRCWLKAKGIDNKVNLLPMSPPAMLAAFKTGQIAGGINAGPNAVSMRDSGGTVVATSMSIAKDYGCAGINVESVETSYAKAHPDVVQGYVCAMIAAWKLTQGPDKVSVLNKASDFLGYPRDLGVTAFDSLPWFTPAEAVQMLGEPGKEANGTIAQSYVQTGAWLQGQGRLDSPPSVSVIANHIDSSFARNAVNGSACPK